MKSHNKKVALAKELRMINTIFIVQGIDNLTISTGEGGIPVSYSYKYLDGKIQEIKIDEHGKSCPPEFMKGIFNLTRGSVGALNGNQPFQSICSNAHPLGKLVRTVYEVARSDDSTAEKLNEAKNGIMVINANPPSLRLKVAPDVGLITKNKNKDAKRYIVYEMSEDEIHETISSMDAFEIRLMEIFFDQRGVNSYYNATVLCNTNDKSIFDYISPDTLTALLKLKFDNGRPLAAVNGEIYPDSDVRQFEIWLDESLILMVAEWCCPEFRYFLIKYFSNYTFGDKRDSLTKATKAYYKSVKLNYKNNIKLFVDSDFKLIVNVKK